MVLNCNEPNFSYFANPNPFVGIKPFSFINDLSSKENPFKYKSPPPGFSSDLNNRALPFKPKSLSAQEFLQYFVQSPLKKVPSITFFELEEEIDQVLREEPDQDLKILPGKTVYRGNMVFMGR